MRYWYFYLAFLMISCGAVTSEQTNIPNSWPTKRNLMETFRDADTVFIIYAKEDYAVTDVIVNGVAAMNIPDDRFKVMAVRDDKVTEQQIKNHPIYVVGTKANLVLNRINDNLPIRFIENGFVFDNKTYKNKTDIFKISFYPNLYNPKMPLTVISGNNEDELVKFIQKQFDESWGYFYWDNWGYQIYDEGQRAVLGNFSNDSTTLWTIDKKLHWDFDYSGKEIKSTTHLKYINHGAADVDGIINTFDATAQQTISSLENFTGKTLNTNITYHIYKSAELKALMLNEASQSNIDFTVNAIHSVINNEFNGKYDETLAMLVARNLLGEPSIMALEEGLAVVSTANWQNTNYHYLAGNLAAGDALPSLKNLLSNEAFEGESDYLAHIAAASFVDFLIQQKGKDNFLMNYLKWQQNDSYLVGLENEWHQYVMKTAAASSIASIKSTAKKQTFLKGFNYAHEGYQIYNGYMGSESDNSIAKLKTLGVNSLTLIPYSGFQSLTKPYPFHYTTGAGGENDISIIHAAYTAHQNGMSIMLKPQLWSWLGWTGDITMQNEADWNLFFEYYEEWIMHYAIMAEIYRFDMFCIGVEFQNASLSEHNKWDELFDKVRKVYSGQITYAANWGTEFESVSFWDKLDFISVNCYYPLSTSNNPTDAELLTAFEKNLDIIEKVHAKYQLPVVFTEIGFKSIAAPWIQPHKDADEQEYNETSQRRCYEAMIKAMDDEKWINGIYIWKWPSYMDFSADYAKDFNPCNKEAEKTISKWFLNKP